MQGAGAGKGVLGTHVPLLKEQQQTEAERGHPVKLEAHAAQAPNKRPKAGQPGSSVPPEDVHTVKAEDREASLQRFPPHTHTTRAACWHHASVTSTKTEPLQHDCCVFY